MIIHFLSGSDEHTAAALSQFSQLEDMGQVTLTTGEATLEQLSQSDRGSDILVITPNLVNPEQFVRKAREQSDLPIMVIGDFRDCVRCLDAGANYFVGFRSLSNRQLLSTLHALLRTWNNSGRSDGSTPKKQVLTHGSLELHVDSLKVYVDKSPVILTASQFKILQHLIENKGRVLTRTNLTDAAYGDRDVISDRNIDSQIKRIRQRIRVPGLIRSIYSIGYTVDKNPN